MLLRLGFYGHSTCAYRSETSFLDILAEQLNAHIVNTGVRMGSEERALLALKHTRPHIAVVFHSQSRLIPTLSRSHDCDARSNRGLEEPLTTALEHYRTSLRDVELERARLYGAALQIEHYCRDQHTVLINCVDPRHPLPEWLALTRPDTGAMTLARQHRCEFDQHANGVTAQGNRLIAAHIYQLIQERSQ